MTPTTLALAWAFASGTLAQPPLPPQERPHVLGTVLTISATDGLALETGTAAPLAEGIQVRGAASVEAIGPGDLVEVVKDDNGMVMEIEVLPRLSDWRPLAEMVKANAPVSRFWWQHDGQDYPDSIYSAEVKLALTARASAIAATAAYAAPGADSPLTFLVLGHGDAVIWEKTLEPGETAEVTAPLSQGASVGFRCRRPDGSIPDHTHCVWASPRVLLREYGDIQLHPNATTDLVTQLAEDLGQIAPGRVLVALPLVIGLTPSMAKTLREDLLIALGARYEVAGATTQQAPGNLSAAVTQAAQAVEADTVAAAEIRYAAEGSIVTAVLLNVATNETLAQAEITLKP